MATQGADKGQYLQYRLEHPEGTHQAGACCHIPCNMRGVGGNLGGGGSAGGGPGRPGVKDSPAAKRLLGFLGSLGVLPSPPFPPPKRRGRLLIAAMS